MSLSIVLIRPEIPQNTGNIARTCAALGATLHLVHPLGFSISDRYLKRAGLDYWSLLTVKEWPDTDSFLDAVDLSHCYFFTKRAPLCYTDVSYEKDCYLIFGRETKGFDPEVVERAKDHMVRIPIREEARCLNLSNSAAVAAYEYERQHGFQNLVKEYGVN